MNKSLKRVAVGAVAAALCLSPSACADDHVKVERNVLYGLYSGLGMFMDVYTPAEPNGYGIVFISGSGWTRELSRDATPLTQTGQEKVYAVPLAEAGYRVFNVSHRAAPTFRYPAPVEDVQRAVRFIRHNAEAYGIRADRIGGMGGSSGAHLISALATMDGAGDPDAPSPVDRESAKIQCAVVRAVPADLRENPEAPLFGFRGNAGKPGSMESWQMNKASPITYVTPDDGPMLFLHGDNDEVVPFEQSEAMHAALEKAGIAAKVIRVPGGGHGPRFEYTEEVDGKRVRKIPQDAPDYIGEMLAWFETYLVE